MIRLHKCSAPNVWHIDYASIDEAVTELRKHICADCLAGSIGFLNEIVDVQIGDLTIECRDPDTLLSTPCGVEYEIEEVE